VIGIDTNLLIRYLTRDDPAQTVIADQVIESRTAQDPGYVTTVVAAELWWVLDRAYAWPAARIASALEGIAAAEEMRMENADCVVAALAAARRGLGFADALICAVAVKAGASELATLDKNAGKLARARYVGAVC
jgi:predicted nucleic-acid-binding protein